MNRYKSSILCVLLLIATITFANTQFKLGGTAVERLSSNVINGLLTVDETIWVANGRLLSKTDDLGETWIRYNNTDIRNLDKGGIPVLKERNGEIWYSVVFDTTFAGDDILAGGGLGYTDDNGETWHYIPQPIDSAYVTEYEPVMTPIQNTTWDLALTDSSIWIASWGGGIRRSIDGGETWQVITADDQPLSPTTNFAHMGFSLMFDEEAIWAGTGKGIYKTKDGGRTWINYTHRESGISGNWVRAIDVQFFDNKKIIWVSTAETDGSDSTEYRAIAKSEDDGNTWTVMLEGQYAHEFGFEGNGAVYVATDNGMFKSLDLGATWALFPLIQDSETGEAMYTTEMSDMVQGPQNSIWLGSLDGLARSFDNGMTWKIFRATRPAGSDSEPQTYAYPNPFSPARDNLIGGEGYVRMQYHLSNPSEVTIKIYDFGMNLVKSVVENKIRNNAGDYSEVWNGRNGVGDMVANGVYFYKLEIKGKSPQWGKIMVVN